jgi:hypothetical protein
MDAGESLGPPAVEEAAKEWGSGGSGRQDLENRDPNADPAANPGERDGGAVLGEAEGGSWTNAKGKGAAGRRNALAKAVQVRPSE